MLDDPASFIARAFGARFVVVAPAHTKLADQLMRSPYARLSVTSPSGWLFELL